MFSASRSKQQGFAIQQKVLDHEGAMQVAAATLPNLLRVAKMAGSATYTRSIFYLHL